jgi:hypothetical protein
VYSITNISAGPLEWEVQFSAAWLSCADVPQGTLEAGESTDVTIDVDAGAALPDGLGPAVGHIMFVDSSTGEDFADRTVSVDSVSEGWTEFTPSPDTRMVYVSSSTGDDGNDGLDESSAKRTLAAGKALVRHGYPDWLLLRRGDTWQEDLGQWKLSGRSSDEPMLVSSYGNASPRPLLQTGTKTGLRTNGGAGSPPSIDHVAFVGLHFHANGYNGHAGPAAVLLLLPSADILLEDCMFEAYGTNLVLQGFGGARLTNIRLRRSVVVDSFAVNGDGHSQGLYAYAVDGLLVEENVFDHNGWSESVPAAKPDIFNHNLYIDNGCTGVVVRGNIIANGASHGLQLRCGGIVTGNLFVHNSISLLVGGGSTPEPGGVTAEVHDNVVLDGKDIDPANPRGWGLCLANISSGNVTGNIVAHNVQGGLPIPVEFQGTVAQEIGVHALAFEDNIIHDWGGGLVISGGAGKITGLSLVRNDVQDLSHAYALVEHYSAGSVAGVSSSENSFFAQNLSLEQWTLVGQSAYPLSTWMGLVGDVTSSDQQVSYVDPDRSVAAYNALVGGTPDLSGFLAEARAQSVANWHAEYTAAQVIDYIRAGFEPDGP